MPPPPPLTTVAHLPPVPTMSHPYSPVPPFEYTTPPPSRSRPSFTLNPADSGNVLPSDVLSPEPVAAAAAASSDGGGLHSSTYYGGQGESLVPPYTRGIVPLVHLLAQSQQPFVGDRGQVGVSGRQCISEPKTTVYSSDGVGVESLVPPYTRGSVSSSLSF